MSEAISVSIQVLFTAVVFLAGFFAARSGLQFSSAASAVAEGESEAREIDRELARLFAQADRPPGTTQLIQEFSRQRTAVLSRSAKISLDVLSNGRSSGLLRLVVSLMAAMTIFGLAAYAGAIGLTLGMELSATLAGAGLVAVAMATLLVVLLCEVEVRELRTRSVEMAMSSGPVLVNCLAADAVDYTPTLDANRRVRPWRDLPIVELSAAPEAPLGLLDRWRSWSRAPASSIPSAGEALARLDANWPKLSSTRVAEATLDCMDECFRAILGENLSTLTSKAWRTTDEAISHLSAINSGRSFDQLSLRRLLLARQPGIATKGDERLIDSAEVCLMDRPGDLWNRVLVACFFVRRARLGDAADRQSSIQRALRIVADSEVDPRPERAVALPIAAIYALGGKIEDSRLMARAIRDSNLHILADALEALEPRVAGKTMAAATSDSVDAQTEGTEPQPWSRSSLVDRHRQNALLIEAYCELQLAGAIPSPLARELRQQCVITDPWFHDPVAVRRLNEYVMAIASEVPPFEVLAMVAQARSQMTALHPESREIRDAARRLAGR